MKHVFCDFSKVTGTLKPQHGLVGSPEGMAACFSGGSILDGNQFTDSPDNAEAAKVDAVFREIGSPLVRIREIKSGGYGKKVDIPYVFRDYSKDPDDPSNWYLSSTDTHLKGLSQWSHGELIFRLGAPREQWAPIYNNKPEDPDKFAKICINYIRHLNEGWADGLHMGIKYWEIWERADDPECWSKGTAQDYYELYGKTAAAIKAQWPESKVGGPAAAFCGGDNKFLKGFLKYVTENDLPCDFITWNYFGESPREAFEQAKKVRALVKEAGLAGKAEIFNTAWNCMTHGEDGFYQVPNVCNARGAAFGAALMIGMQKAGMDGSTYYECVKGLPWCGLVQLRFVRALKPLYALQAFAKLYKYQNEAYVSTSGRNLYALASSNQEGGAVLVSVMQTKKDEIQFETGCKRKKAVYAIDEGKNLLKLFETEEADFTVKTEGATVLLVETV